MFLKAAKQFNADAVATAHHMNDNAETVLFNLARGSGLSGMKGISDGNCLDEGVNVIRPFIACTRGEIDAYIGGNCLKYVEDETNLGDDYTRNYIRHNVIPQLEKAVPSAVKSIYRFSRLAAEDEEYFEGLIAAQNMLNLTIWGVEICFCREKPIFTRAAVKALKLLKEDAKDYTYGHIERLYDLQFAQNGKKFEFLQFIAFAEEGKIAICRRDMLGLKQAEAASFADYVGGGRKDYCGQRLEVCSEEELERRAVNASKADFKALKFDSERIPQAAAVRFMQSGDRFTKFGGGTKNLGDYFTDKKIPVRLRGQIPLVADGKDILIICGVEISDKVKITAESRAIKGIICADYVKTGGKNGQ